MSINPEIEQFIQQVTGVSDLNTLKTFPHPTRRGGWVLYESSCVEIIRYDQSSRWSCLDGPAWYFFHPSYAPTKRYYVHGVEYGFNEYWQHPLVVEHKLNKIFATGELL